LGKQQKKERINNKKKRFSEDLISIDSSHQKPACKVGPRVSILAREL
jgi:hypothetical protein